MPRDDPRHGPMDENIRATANRIAGVLGGAFPPDYGFALLIFGLDGSEGRMNYISNARREDMIAALHELLARFEGRYDDKGGSA